MSPAYNENIPNSYEAPLRSEQEMLDLILTVARADERIRAVVLSQIFREAAVARSPEPAVEVRDEGDGRVFVSIRYADADTGEAQVIGFPLGGN